MHGAFVLNIAIDNATYEVPLRSNSKETYGRAFDYEVPVGSAIASSHNPEENLYVAMEESTPACRDDNYADSFEDSFEDSESEANNSTIRKHYENQSYRKQVRRTTSVRTVWL